jgi:L-2,4-diaminobutyric acid acetyltransferase
LNFIDFEAFLRYTLSTSDRIEVEKLGNRLFLTEQRNQRQPMSRESHSVEWKGLDVGPPEFRPPSPGDAAEIWQLVQQTPALDANSPYAYLLLCTDFAETCAVAEARGEVTGFLLGYRPPERPESYFVWQVGVSEDHRGRGVAAGLLDWTFARLVDAGVRFLEATITPSNEASRSLFQGFARRRDAAFQELPGFPSQLFPNGAHEEEVRIRIGPINEVPVLHGGCEE